MPLSEITPSARKVNWIVSQIEEGDIKIPAFQRGFVWEQEQVLELLDSMNSFQKCSQAEDDAGESTQCVV